MVSKKNKQDHVETAILKLGKTSNTDKTLAPISALVAMIPGLGGSLVQIMTEYRSNRDKKRIADSLLIVYEALKNKGNEYKTSLNKDEVIEIVQKTLEEIACVSSEEKLKYLNNTLRKAFTSGEVEYSLKQTYLSILKDLSIGEIEILKIIYKNSDPFIQIEPCFPQNQGIYRENVIMQGSLIPNPQYLSFYKEPDSGKTLNETIKNYLKDFSSESIMALIDSLDGKKLTNILPNLEKRTVKVMQEQFPANLINKNTGVFNQQNQIYGMQDKSKEEKTPIEASSTELGKHFINYII